MRTTVLFILFCMSGFVIGMFFGYFFIINFDGEIIIKERYEKINNDLKIYELNNYTKNLIEGLKNYPAQRNISQTVQNFEGFEE